MDNRLNVIMNSQEAILNSHGMARAKSSVDGLNRMYAQSKGACAICGVRPDRSLALDHCHKTGKLRGLLCFSCNVALGHFKDDPKLLRKAIRYLKDR